MTCRNPWMETELVFLPEGLQAHTIPQQSWQPSGLRAAQQSFTVWSHCPQSRKDSGNTQTHSNNRQSCIGGRKWKHHLKVLQIWRNADWIFLVYIFGNSLFICFSSKCLILQCSTLQLSKDGFKSWACSDPEVAENWCTGADNSRFKHFWDFLSDRCQMLFLAKSFIWQDFGSWQ